MNRSKMNIRKIKAGFGVLAIVIVALLSIQLAQLVSAFSLTTPQLLDINDSSAAIYWTSDEPATTQVMYGLQYDRNEAPYINSTLISTHVARLTGLKNNTFYYYSIFSGVPGTTKQVYDDNNRKLYNFTTARSIDSTPPVISNITVSLTANSAIISWKTNEPATSLVRYGIAPDLNRPPANSTILKTNHSLSITTEEGKAYSFEVESCDAKKNCATGTTAAGGFTAGIGNAPIIVASMPELKKGDRVVVSGTTKPFAVVSVYMNNEILPSYTTDADAFGSFNFGPVPLPLQSNKITIKATDQARNVISQNYTVTIDSQAPVASLDFIPAKINQTKITITGTTSEPGKVYYSLKKELDRIPPDRVLGLKVAEVASVRLNWTANDEPDLYEYGIYRNNARIAVVNNVTTSYVDERIAQGTTYNYRISAVDTSCNEGALSELATITTTIGKAGVEPGEQLAKANFSCESVQKSIDVDATGKFSFDVNLEQGPNKLTVTVLDRAGNSVDLSRTIVVDTEPPKILEWNGDLIEVSYEPDVIVTGKVSEQAGINVWVNNKSQKPQVTDSQGNFKFKVALRQDPATSISEKRIQIDTGEAWVNKIKIQADDTVWKSETKEAVVKYAKCGFGGKYSVRIDGPMPSTLTPRLMLEGQQQLGFSVNLTYLGLFNGTIVKQPTVTIVDVGKAMAEKYDQGWLAEPVVNFIRQKKNEIGYISLPFKALEAEIPGDTYYAKEEVLSNNRLGQCTLFPKNAGCFRALVVVNIQYQELIPTTRQDPATQKMLSETQAVNSVQKVCLPIEVQIDKRINPDVFLKGFMKRSVKVLEKLIDSIDRVLKPVEKAGKAAMYGCFGSNALSWFTYFFEKMSCEFSFSRGLPGLLESIGGKSGMKQIAEAGLCDVYFPENNENDDNQQARSSCNSCGSMIKNRKAVENLRDALCDRVACPNVPTLQKYINDAQKNKPIELPPVPNDNSGLKYFTGSSCSFAQTEKYGRMTQGLSSKYEGVKEVYRYYNAQKKPAAASTGFLGSSETTQAPAGSSVQNDDDVNCKGAHPADPRCCGWEYMQTWGGACDLPLAKDVTFDEIKQSTCLAAQTRGPGATNELKASSLDTNGIPPIDCNPGIFNAAAGFCEPGTGQPVIDPIEMVGVRYNKDYASSGAKNKDIATGQAPVFIGVVPYSEEKRGATVLPVIGQLESAPATNYNIYRGQIVDELTWDKNPTGTSGQTAASNKIRVNSDIVFIPDTETEASKCFDVTEYPESKYPDEKDRINHQKDCFVDHICKGAQQVLVDETKCNTVAKSKFDEIYAKLTTNDKSYIIEPASNIFNSVRCLCIPALQGQLGQIKRIATLIKTCLESIAITGDATAGACQALVSQYVCDLFWDALSCSIQKFSGGTGGTRTSQFPGLNILGAAVTSGDAVYKSNLNRYGDTNLWNSLFVDKKLANAMCLWAFTGTWGLDMRTLYNSAVEAQDIESIGAFTRGERRFVAFNPTSSPRGLVTWNYRFGFMLDAGADLSWRLKLKCSNSMRCDPSAGFKNGKCDCYGKPERDFIVPNTGGQLRKNEILGGGAESEVIYTLEATDPSSGVRYDTAVLEWDWIDKATNQFKNDSVEKKIGLAGSSPPAFCTFDIVNAAFRCDLGIGDYAGARLGDITPKYPENQKVFTLNDPVDFDIPITTSRPADWQAQTKSAGENNKYIKYLTYQIKNQNGEVVRKSASIGENKITKEGSFTTNLLPASFKLENGWFSQVVTTTNANLAYYDGQTWVSNDLLFIMKGTPTKTYVAHIDLKTKTYEVYVGLRETVGGGAAKPQLTTNDIYQNGIWGHWKKVKITPQQGQEVMEPVDKGTVPGNNILQLTKEGVSIELKQWPLNAQLIEVIFSPPVEQAVTGPCADVNKNTAYTWTAVFTLYDAEQTRQVWGPSSQVTVDSATEQEQIKEIPFQVVCNAALPQELAAKPVSSLKRCDENPAVVNEGGCFCNEILYEKAKADPTNVNINFDCGTGTDKGIYCMEIETGKKSCVKQIPPELFADIPSTLRQNYKQTILSLGNEGYLIEEATLSPTNLNLMVDISSNKKEISFSGSGEATAKLTLKVKKDNELFVGYKTISCCQTT